MIDSFEVLSMDQTRRQHIAQHLHESAQVKQRLLEECTDDILTAADRIAEAFRSGCKLLLCGNGGSAADCQHLAAEFTSRLTSDFVRPALPALALTTDTSFLTAYTNDFGFDGVFARQIEAFGRPGDILIAISTGGNSPNVVQAVETAHRLGLATIAMTGSEGRLRQICDIAISVPSSKTQFIQESHLSIEHLLCHLVERTLFGEQGQPLQSQAA